MASFSHFPAIPLPQLSPRPPLVQLDPSDCVYLAGQRAQMRGFSVRRLSPDAYQMLMDAAFRRSGRIIYQPICAECRACVPIRVPVERFSPGKSQRRCWRKNSDLLVSVGPPEATAEKHALYVSYQTRWHAGQQSTEYDAFVAFLYESPVETMEFVYRLPTGQIVAVGLCDISAISVSSVYLYFDPAFAERSVGTFSAMYEIHWARARGIPFWYAGYHVQGCGAMEYKARFRPYELLGTDGFWRKGSKQTGRPRG